MNESQPKVDQSELKELLHGDKDVCVTFTKRDGTSRTMRCTTAEGRIPADKAPKGTGTVAVSDAVQRVFDCEVQAWRSFRWDSVIEYKLCN